MRAGAVAAAVVAAAVLLSGCGGGSATNPGDDPTVGASGTAEPADIAKATRTIEIKANDELKFDPTMVDVKPGETVAFKVVNTGKVDHEFEVGDGAFQAQHEKEMQSGMTMTDDPTGIVVKAGQTKSIAFTFPSAGSLLFACHQPGHYGAGMKGTVKIG